MKKILTFLLAITVLFSSVDVSSINIYAADGKVKIFLGDSTTPRHHKAIAEGSRSEELSFELKDGKVKKSAYSSDNPSSFKIVEENGKNYISGVSEGVGYVTLSIETTTGKKYKERLFISVYKGTESYVGIFNSKATIYRGASVNADVENNDNKGECKKGTTVNVVALCNDFYLIRTMDGTKFEDDKDTGFVEKKYIDVQATEIEVEEEYVLNLGDNICLKAKVLPNFATNKKLYYSSDNNRIVTVDQNGNLKTKKVGQANVTIYTAKHKLTKKCQIIVKDKSEYSWDEQSFANKKSSSFKVNANWIRNKKIKVKWNKQEAAKQYIIMRKESMSKKFKKVKTLSFNQNKFIDNKVKNNKKYWYKVICKRKGMSNIQSKVVKAKKKRKVVLNATAQKTKSIKLSWKKLKNAKKITIFRKKERDKYKKIKTLSGIKTSYIDKSIKYFTKYDYRLKIVWKDNKTTFSNEVGCKSKYNIDKQKNIDYFKKNYPFVCLDESVNINEYSVFNEYYSPIKYRFTGDTLEIHIYYEFVTYDKKNNRAKASRTLGYGNKTYIDMIKAGIKKWYSIDVANDKNEFVGINYTVKPIIHDKEFGSYNANQHFYEVQVAGEHIDGGEIGDYWYYTGTGDYKYTTYIYMTDIRDALKQGEYLGETIKERQDRYMYIIAHEMGHALGLDDGYPDDGHDRFADNDETGIFYKKYKKGTRYDNIMVEITEKEYLLPNDIEMMLYAYSLSQGRPWRNLQSYKTNPKLGTVFSDVIKNRNDYYVEEKK